MPLNIEKFSGPGSTDPRRKFWDGVVEYLNAQRKIQGKHIKVTEFYDYGSLLDVPDQRAGNAPMEPCPPTLHVQFSGISFECGCSLISEGSAGSYLITGEGDANSFVTQMSLGNIVTPGCGDCGNETQHQLWFSGSGASISPHVVISFWNEDDACTGGPSGTDFNEYFGMLMVLLSGVYYLVAYINQSILFFGTTTDLSIPFVNILGCSLEYQDYSGDTGFCMFNGVITPTMNVVSSGGIATVTIP